MITQLIALLVVNIILCLTDEEIKQIYDDLASQFKSIKNRNFSINNETDYLYLASNKFEALENNVSDYANLYPKLGDPTNFSSLLTQIEEQKKPRGNFSSLYTTSLLCNTNVNYSYYDSISSTATSFDIKIRLKNSNTTNVYFLPFIVKFAFTTASLDIKLWDINYAPISIGVCQMSSPNCIDKSTYNFTGIQIAFFGDNCYHVDFFIEGNYNSTSRSCLSKYELYKLLLKVDGNELTMKLHLEDWNFFSEKLIGQSYYFCGGLMDKRVILSAKGELKQ